MYSQLHGYDYFHCLDLANEIELSANSQRIPAGFAKPSWLTRKHHLLNMHIRNQLFNAIRELATSDKQDKWISSIMEMGRLPPIRKMLFRDIL